MIASISGILTHKSPQYLIVDVHGIGYQVYTSLQSFYSLPEPKESLTLHIHTHHSAETLQLYGFVTPVEREAFVLLISVSGIGPRSALGILSGLCVRDLVCAVQEGDLHRLRSVPGIGAKTAGRLALELKDKLANLMPQARQEPDRLSPVPQNHQMMEDALSALINLGYPRQGAKEAVKKVCQEYSLGGPEDDPEKGSLSVEELIRSSLKQMSNL